MAKAPHANAAAKTFWEGWGARILALALILICAAGIAYYHRNDLFPPPAASQQAAVNPEFVKCRARRVAAIDKMRAEKTIDDKRHEEFSARAIAFCAARFPPNARPGKPGGPPGLPPGMTPPRGANPPRGLPQR